VVARTRAWPRGLRNGCMPTPGPHTVRSSTKRMT
jgi:hypothetical protein